MSCNDVASFKKQRNAGFKSKHLSALKLITIHLLTWTMNGFDMGLGVMRIRFGCCNVGTNRVFVQYRKFSKHLTAGSCVIMPTVYGVST